MTGCAVITDAASIVIVEGGQKAQKKYSHLMLNRIKWNDAADDIDAEEPKRWVTQQNLEHPWTANRFLLKSEYSIAMCELRPNIHKWGADARLLTELVCITPLWDSSHVYVQACQWLCQGVDWIHKEAPLWRLCSRDLQNRSSCSKVLGGEGNSTLLGSCHVRKVEWLDPTLDKTLS